MIDFSRAELTNFTVHYVGNKGLGESLTCSEKEFELNDDFVKETLLRYFLAPFKTDIYHRFSGKGDLSGDNVRTCCEQVFKDTHAFMDASRKIASILYDQSMHPK